MLGSAPLSAEQTYVDEIVRRRAALGRELLAACYISSEHQEIILAPLMCTSTPVEELNSSRGPVVRDGV